MFGGRLAEQPSHFLYEKFPLALARKAATNPLEPALNAGQGAEMALAVPPPVEQQRRERVHRFATRAQVVGRSGVEAGSKWRRHAHGRPSKREADSPHRLRTRRAAFATSRFNAAG